MGLSGRRVNRGVPGRGDRAHNPKVAGSNPAPATKITGKSNREGPLQSEEALDVSPQFGDQTLRGWAQHYLAHEIMQEAPSAFYVMGEDLVELRGL